MLTNSIYCKLKSAQREPSVITMVTGGLFKFPNSQSQKSSNPLTRLTNLLFFTLAHYKDEQFSICWNERNVRYADIYVPIAILQSIPELVVKAVI